MIKLLKVPARVLNAFIDVLASEPEKEEITEFRINLKPSQRETPFFYPRQVFRSHI